MDSKIYERIIKYVSERFNLHLELCFKGDVLILEDVYFSEMNIKRGGLDVHEYVDSLFGFTEDETKNLITRWVGEKMPNIKFNIDSLWYQTRYPQTTLNLTYLF
jgi:hypothetical protein